MSPQLSVIVPVFNVQDYLADCLDSIAAQTMADLEAVMVDDGSTDGSTAIAERYAAADPRFRLVRQQNGGLGSARNLGVRSVHPESRYLGFVDSDDVLPRGAYQYLYEALEESGSDLATGNVYRLQADRRVQNHQHAHLARTVLGTHVSRDPWLLTDRIACNKLFRREFWERHRLAFPEGVLYEDIALTVPAHFLAEAVDVVHRHVYYWRIRSGSITQRAAEAQGARDRIEAVNRTSRFLAERSPAHQRAFEKQTLSYDFRFLMDAFPKAGEEYREAVVAGAADFAERLEPEAFADLPVDLRAKWELIRGRRTAELLDLMLLEQRSHQGFEVAGGVRRRAVYRSGSGKPIPLPARVTTLRGGELPLTAKLEEVGWSPEGLLELHGCAYVENLPDGSALTSFRTAVLTGPDRRRSLLPLRSRPSVAAGRGSWQELHDHGGSGFLLTVDPERFKRDGRWQVGSWSLRIVLGRAGLLRNAGLRAAGSNVDFTRVRPLDPDRLLRIGFDKGVVILKVEEVQARIDGHRLVDGCLEITGRVRERHRPVQLTVNQKGSSARVEVPVRCVAAEGGWRPFLAAVPLDTVGSVAPAVQDGPRELAPSSVDGWWTRLVTEGGAQLVVSAAPELASGSYPLPPGPGGPHPRLGEELQLFAGTEGQLMLERTRRPAAEQLAWTPGGRLEIAGTLPGDAGPVELVLRHSGLHEEARVPVTQADGGFTASLDPAAHPGPRGGHPLREGHWYGFLRPVGADSRDGELSLRLATSTLARLPLDRPGEGRRFAVTACYRDMFVLSSGAAPGFEQQSPYRTRQLAREAYPAARRLPLRDTVLYSSFDGRQYGDAPRAVHEELLGRDRELQHLWTVDDEQVPLPLSARAVALGGAEWHEALATSRYLVTNTQLPPWFRRREGQTVVQCGTGVPVKRTGLALRGSVYADHSRLAELPEQSRQWSLLLSPNRSGTAALRRAWDYRGEILGDCSPRTDLLHAEDREKLAEVLRRRLDLPEGRRTVLFAPTFRDHRAVAGGPLRYDFAPGLDLAALAGSLGDGYRLLVRRHPDTVASFPIGGAVTDVTAHPDAVELLLVADVLVTDYSSLAVDFCRTGKPVLLFTPDLDQYRDSVRGLEIDLPRHAPGPLLRTQDELVQALLGLDAVAADHAERYASFREAHCGVLDAEGARRAVDRMLALG
ncbi:bifunctional glycosyltransferase/CDP-glycerol:glycerophosphate glycerophosphotransferase [Streptacidiphilus carbonis]|uniref:bifunctional glycosyltransferase/CDP-glycerol:glycerophosphate glycerophosphotransferase n=1 Tax=Streptacidiphilus carbonis TaxID=105422 RepID=UPI0005A7F406|nr:CDP-glycerol glycerophosphotransferase family protein [Streptacidiphilus carbonis]